MNVTEQSLRTEHIFNKDVFIPHQTNYLKRLHKGFELQILDSDLMKYYQTPSVLFDLKGGINRLFLDNTTTELLERCRIKVWLFLKTIYYDCELIIF